MIRIGNRLIYGGITNLQLGACKENNKPNGLWGTLPPSSSPSTISTYHQRTCGATKFFFAFCCFPAGPAFLSKPARGRTAQGPIRLLSPVHSGLDFHAVFANLEPAIPFSMIPIYLILALDCDLAF